jgi:hypothetical protein
MNAVSSKDPSLTKVYKIAILNKAKAHTLCGCAIGTWYPSTSFYGFLQGFLHMFLPITCGMPISTLAMVQP